MQQGLSFDQAPPLTAPLRFFLTAPLFGLAAAGLLLWHGPGVFASRWTPLALGLTHLMTLGFMTMVMAGALLQLLAVVVGSPVPAARRVAAVVHAGLVLGTPLLAAGLATGAAALLEAALPLLALAFTVLLAAIGTSLWRAPVVSATLPALRLAAAALLATVTLGVLLAATLAGRLDFSIAKLVALHAAWGLAGWAGLLVAGVAYQVVPMFQMTPAYPAGLARRFAPVAAVLLLFWSAPGLPQATSRAVTAALCLAFAAFALATLRLQAQRRRRQADATLYFWRTAMASLLAAAALMLAGAAVPQSAEFAAFGLVVGVLAIVGFATSAINGMLYKIVPFLLWLHLQTEALGRLAVPPVKEILPEAACRGQYRAHLAALILLAAAAFHPDPLIYPAALAFALSMSWLAGNLLAAARVYWEIKTRLAAPAAPRGR